MKNIKKILLGTLVLFSLQFGLGGCVAEVEGGGYYGDPWYHDGPWLDGGGWDHDRGRRDYGPHDRVDIDIHPPGFRH
ncbi:MAG TPA: hypothetical protein VNW23_06990 [Opitutaceae bacterium]|jgi:hypothetical protein|nr:hypothetical protein [Opitutaceae bacterium]HXA14857.1 hypothetical protein [Opitutaceae bacterium]